MLKKIFFALFIRPLVLIVSGVHVKGREKLPLSGPCIIAANHNSHLDTMVLMSLFPISKVHDVRPVGAADYFMKNKWFAWFSQNMIGIIPLKRRPSKEEGHPLAGVKEALTQGQIVIIFPEGSRGEPEEMGTFKTGIAHLAKEFSLVPVLPVYIHGAGKALPKGEALFVPFIIDVCIADPIYFQEENHQDFVNRLEASVKSVREK
ncbi:MAG TPA: 1-acyl-sn-glycerol-3-phosphate acyltransferase [Epsilonproteobacteria bacterium]|nr:1-acyl-sn-glycerol-3-phosphate acyltransferase [Campylobacterota bacterium]